VVTNKIGLPNEVLTSLWETLLARDEVSAINSSRRASEFRIVCSRRADSHVASRRARVQAVRMIAPAASAQGELVRRDTDR